MVTYIDTRNMYACLSPIHGHHCFVNKKGSIWTSFICNVVRACRRGAAVAPVHHADTT